MHVYLYAIGISQLHNVTICEDGSKAFKCTFNSSINSSDVHWYRLIMDTGTTERVNQSSDIHLTTSTINNTLNETSLNITKARKSHTGYYWVKLPSDDICSNISIIVTTSMYVCMQFVIALKLKLMCFYLNVDLKYLEIIAKYKFKRE